MRHDAIDPERYTEPCGPRLPIRVRDRMTSPPVTIRADEPVRKASEVMKARGIRHLLVVDPDKYLVGILSEGDLRAILSAPASHEPVALGGLTVSRVMMPRPITVHPDLEINEVAGLMYKGKLDALPVTDGGKVLGILTRSDLLRTLMEVLTEQVGRPPRLRPGSG